MPDPKIAPKPRQTSPQPVAGPGTFPQNPPVPPPSDPSRAFPTPGSSQSNQNQSWSLVPHPSKTFLSSTVPQSLLGFCSRPSQTPPERLSAPGSFQNRHHSSTVLARVLADARLADPPRLPQISQTFPDPLPALNVRPLQNLSQPLDRPRAARPTQLLGFPQPLQTPSQPLNVVRDVLRPLQNPSSEQPDPTQLLRLPTSPHSLLGFWDIAPKPPQTHPDPPSP